MGEKRILINPGKMLKHRIYTVSGFQSRTPVDTGVKATADWYREMDLI